MVSNPSAVKKEPGVVFPFTSQYLNVLFIAMRTDSSSCCDTVNPESASKIMDDTFSYTIPDGPFIPTFIFASPAGPAGPVGPVFPIPVGPVYPIGPVAPVLSAFPGVP